MPRIAIFGYRHPMDSKRTLLTAVCITLATVAACDVADTPVRDDVSTDARAPFGKADHRQDGSCLADGDLDACGGPSKDGCWCDDECVSYGDCCADKSEVCDDPQTVDPLSEAFCTDGPMTRDQALRYIAPGEPFDEDLEWVEFDAVSLERSCGPTGCDEWTEVADGIIAGNIVATSLGAVWRPRVSVQVSELAASMKAEIYEGGFTPARLRLWGKKAQPIRVYYPSTGRFAWEQGVTFNATQQLDSGRVSINFGSSGEVSGESTFRTGEDCFQFRNVHQGYGGREYMTVIYGRFAPPAP
jgi:hypothetical protein